MKRSYYILTVKSDDGSTKTIFYEGNLTYFLLIERELGKNTDILFSEEITKEEYEYANSRLNK